MGRVEPVFLQVDPARLALREDATKDLRENQRKLVHYSKLVFDLLVASLDQVQCPFGLRPGSTDGSLLSLSLFKQFPNVVKNIFHEAKHIIVERFPDMGHQFIGGFYFLRFICPALVAPASYGLVKKGKLSGS